MAVSPTCEVKNGAAAYASTTGGVDITPAATVIIRLASTVDVTAWSIQCITTDDTSDASAVTAALTIDATAKTATFTAPAAGKAYRFQSRVNSGVDVNGIARPAYTTTFCVYTLSTGRRVMAADETTEGDATFGWIKWLNDLIRNPTAGSSSTTPPGGSSGQVQFHDGASFAGASGMRYTPSTSSLTVASMLAMQATLASAMLVQGTAATGFNLVAPRMQGAVITGVATLSSAMLGSAGTAATGFNLVAPRMQGALVTGVATLQSAMLGGLGTAATGFNLVAPVVLGAVLGGTTVYTGTDIVGLGLSDHRPHAALRRTTLTATAVTNVYAWNVLDEAQTSVVVEVNAVPSGGGAGGSYVRRAAIRADGAVATVGTGGVEASWDAEHTLGVFTGLSQGSGISIGVSGMTGFINIKSPVQQLKVGLTVTRQETSWA